MSVDNPYSGFSGYGSSQYNQQPAAAETGAKAAVRQLIRSALGAHQRPER